MSFEIITDTSANLPAELANKLDVSVLALSIFNGEEPYNGIKEDGSFDYADFYGRLRNKENMKTALINVDEFSKSFETALSAGKDVLAIIMSSGISGTYQSAKIAGDMMSEKYPDRKVIVIDSLSASIGQGLLVYYACEMRKEGKSIDEVAQWVADNRLKMVHNFTVEDLFFLKRGGRLSGGVAIIGTILQIKPLLHVDNEGRLITLDKVNGRKKSLNTIVENFKKNAVDPENQVIAICHGDCIKDAEYVAEKIKKEVNVKDIIIDYTAPVLGAHAGPGVLALFYLAEKR